jgi:hypothetical protein
MALCGKLALEGAMELSPREQAMTIMMIEAYVARNNSSVILK